MRRQLDSECSASTSGCLRNVWWLATVETVNLLHRSSSIWLWAGVGFEYRRPHNILREAWVIIDAICYVLCANSLYVQPQQRIYFEPLLNINKKCMLKFRERCFLIRCCQVVGCYLQGCVLNPLSGGRFVFRTPLDSSYCHARTFRSRLLPASHRLWIGSVFYWLYHRSFSRHFACLSPAFTKVGEPVFVAQRSTGLRIALLC